MNAWIIVMKHVADGIEHDLYRGSAPRRGASARIARAVRARAAHGLVRIAEWIEPKCPCIDAAHGSK